MSPAELYRFPYTAKLIAPWAADASAYAVVDTLLQLIGWPRESATNSEAAGLLWTPHDAVAASPELVAWLRRPEVDRLAEHGLVLEEAPGLHADGFDLIVFYRRDDAEERTERTDYVWGHIVGLVDLSAIGGAS